MSSRRRTWLAIALVLTLAACGSGSSGGDGGGPTSGPDVDFAPTTSTSLSGSLTYKSIRIPAGVTVTGSADLTLTVVGDALIAGGLTAPCHALTVTAGGVLTVSGSVSTDCTVPAQRGSPLALIGKGGYDFEGAHITGSGNVAIVDGPNLTPSEQLSGASVRAPGPTRASAPYRCQMVNTTIDANPPKPKDPVDGVTDGADGTSVIDGCGQLFTGQTGGNLLVQGVTINAADGLNGSDASGTTSARGGNGGNAGRIALVSDKDIDLVGENNFNGGDGGRGGDATATNPAAGGNATATGGKGGSLKPAGGSPPVVIVSNQGSITVSGGLHVTLGTAGRGGHATATAGDGPPGGGKGGNPTATGGDGGDGQAANVNASGAVTVTGSITVTGGGGGDGGDATISVGDGGLPAVAPGSPGGPGGDGVQRGGKGGKGVINGALRAFRADGTEVTVVTQNAPGGNGGKATATKGNGKSGSDNCNPPGKGGDGGPGGAYSGGPGSGGDGTPKGTVGSWSISNAFNGLNGAKGATGGARGAGGTDGSSAPAGVTGYNPTVTNSFQPGQPGGTCGQLTSFTLTPPTENVTVGGSGSVHGTFTRVGSTDVLTAVLKDPNATTRGTITVPASISSFDIPFTVPADFPVGTGTWSVALSGTDVAAVSATFQVIVSQASGTPITLQNGDPNHAIVWFAIEHGNGPWIQLTSSNQTFSWTESQPTGGFAFVVDEGGGSYKTWKYQLDTPHEQSEAADFLAESRPGTNTIGGLLLGVNLNERAIATLGSNVRTFVQNGTAGIPVTWSAQPAGTFDIFASRNSTAGDALKLIQIRGVTVPASATFPMDFGGSAVITPANAVATGVNFGSETWNVESGVLTQAGPTVAPFSFSPISGSLTKNLWFLPPSFEQATDLEFYFATTATRFVEGFFHTPANQTITFPAQINPTVTWVGNRPHIAFALSSDANQLVTSSVSESVSGATINLTSWVSTAFTGNTTAFDYTLPDWSSINFPTAAMFRSGGGGSYSVTAKGSNMANGALIAPVEGLLVVGASKVGTTIIP